MPLISVSDELKELLDRNEPLVKGRYFTFKLYADSAIREKLRRDGVAGVGDDEIIAHLKRLEDNKARRLDRQAIVKARKHQEQRVRRAKQRLEGEL